MIHISDIDDERVKYYRSLRYTPESHIINKIFIAEGEKVVVKLLQSKIEVFSIFALNDFYEKYRHLIKNSNISDESLFYSDKKTLEKIVGFHLHSGVMAIGKQPENCELKELTNKIVALNGLTNTENVGSIVRNCAAFGIDSILVDERTASPYLRRSVRVSMGAVFGMKIHFSNKLIDTLSMLNSRYEYEIISAEITDKSIDFNKYKFPKKFVLIFGSEGDGIDSDILKISNHIIYIPMEQSISSINVSASSAVILNAARN